MVDRGRRPERVSGRPWNAREMSEGRDTLTTVQRDMGSVWRERGERGLLAGA